MAVKFRDLLKETKRVTFDYDGESVTIDYHPGAITPQMQLVAVGMQALGDEKGEMAPGTMQALMNDYVNVIVTMVKTWDVLGEDGVALPVDKQWVSRMPLAFLSAVFAAAVGDMRPNEKSAGG